jgi:fibronectin type 3 domain-containing protein
MSTVVGYNVYRSTTSGGPYTLITSTPVAGVTYTDTAVQAGVTYFYVVTAVDANGNESAFSNEASVTVPTP